MSPEERLDKFFSAPRRHGRLHDSEIDEIALLLERCGHPAAKCPRTYIVLRISDQLGVLDKLLGEGFGDQWFPVESARGMPSCLEQQIANKILQNQSIIETDALDFEHGKHLNITTADAHLFVLGDTLGSGYFGQVNKIVSKVSFKEYALKRIRRRAAFGNKSKEAIREFLAEKERMRRLKHPHVVQYIGSYTDRKHFGLVMSPVADCDLATYMQEFCTEAHASKRSTLRSFFGCLATALSYLHGQSIKHKDIKPANVLVSGSNVLITDFGISHDFLDTTSGAAVHTPRYSAPEVVQGGKRNESADIWSLGCVFIEMAGALQGHDTFWIRKYFNERYTQTEAYHGNLEAVDSLLCTWGETWSIPDRSILVWIRSMLTPRRENRPSAMRVVEMITSDTNATTFCGICCISDEISDSENSISDRDVATLPYRRQNFKGKPSNPRSGMVRKRGHVILSRGGALAAVSLLVALAGGWTMYSTHSRNDTDGNEADVVNKRVSPSYSKTSPTVSQDDLPTPYSATSEAKHSAITMPSLLEIQKIVVQDESTHSTQSIVSQSDQKHQIQTVPTEPVAESTQTTKSTSRAAPSAESTVQASDQSKDTDVALDFIWNLVYVPASWSNKIKILFRYIIHCKNAVGADTPFGSTMRFSFQVAALGMGYVLTDNLSGAVLLYARKFRLVDRSTLPRGVELILYPPAFLFVLFVLVPCWLTRFVIENRAMQACVRSLALLLEFWFIRWVIGVFLSHSFGLQRDLFNDWFGLLVAVPCLLLAIDSALFWDAPSYDGIKPHDLALQRGNLRSVMDILLGIFCLLWGLPSVVGFLRWLR